MTMLVITLMLAATAAGPSAEEPVLVMDFEGVEVAAEVASQVREAVTEALSARGITAVTTQEVVNPEQPLSKSCSAEAACLARLRDEGEVRFILSGSVGRVGSQFLLGLSLIDVDEAEAHGRAGTTAETVEEMLGRADEAVLQLLEPQRVVQPTIELPAQPRFVILEFQGGGLPDGTASNLTQVVASELRRIEGSTVLSKDEVEAMLGAEQLKEVLRGSCDKACFLRIAGALDADFLLLGRVGQLGDTFVVNLTALDQRTTGETKRRTETYQGSPDELIRATRHAVQALFGLDAGTGRLTVGASRTGATLFVNNESLGELPLPPQESLSPGRYSVRLEKSGFYPWRTDVYVNPNDTSVLWADMEKQPQRWYQKWWVWALVGTAVAGGVTGAVVAATSDDPEFGTVQIELGGN
jgi:TolB-like protein